MTHPVVQELEKRQCKKGDFDFKVGDTVEVRVKVKEGDKERIQPFVGAVIARRGAGARETFCVRRIVQGEGVERVFPLQSPNLVSVRVRHRGEVRRAKLYFLRDRTGKATRIRGRVVHAEAEAPTEAKTDAPESSAVKETAQK